MPTRRSQRQTRLTLIGSTVRSRNVAYFDRNYVTFICLSSCLLWLVADARLEGYLVAHADCRPTAQSPELRPFNRDISVEGKR